MSVISPSCRLTPLVVKVWVVMTSDEGDRVATTMATPATINVPEAGRILGLSRNGAYAAAARGEIPVIRIGRKLLVPRKLFMAMLEAPSEEDSA